MNENIILYTDMTTETFLCINNKNKNILKGLFTLCAYLNLISKSIIAVILVLIIYIL